MRFVTSIFAAATLADATTTTPSVAVDVQTTESIIESTSTETPATTEEAAESTTTESPVTTEALASTELGLESITEEQNTASEVEESTTVTPVAEESTTTEIVEESSTEAPGATEESTSTAPVAEYTTEATSVDESTTTVLVPESTTEEPTEEPTSTKQEKLKKGVYVAHVVDTTSIIRVISDSEISMSVNIIDDDRKHGTTTRVVMGYKLIDNDTIHVFSNENTVEADKEFVMNQTKLIADLDECDDFILTVDATFTRINLGGCVLQKDQAIVLFAPNARIEVQSTPETEQKHEDEIQV